MNHVESRFDWCGPRFPHSVYFAILMTPEYNNIKKRRNGQISNLFQMKMKLKKMKTSPKNEIRRENMNMKYLTVDTMFLKCLVRARVKCT